MRLPVFEALGGALGGTQRPAALARKAARGHRPGSGVSRSAYVRTRLQRLAAKATTPAGGQPDPARVRR